MSQEKVEYKKNLKNNRRSIVKKKKIENTLITIAICVVSIAILSWICYSAYSKISAGIEANKETEYVTIDSSALTDYMNSIQKDE